MSPKDPLVWFSVNLQSGGFTVIPDDRLLHRHGSLDISRLAHFADIVRLSPQQPDVIFLQEAKWFNHYGDELLFYVERLLREAEMGTYRGFLTRLRRSHHHQVVFIRIDRLQAVHHWRGDDPDEPTGLYGWVHVIVDGDVNRTLWLKSLHLDPWDGSDRLAEVKRIHGVVAAERQQQSAILAGDFNSYTSRRTPDDGEPQRRFAVMEPAKRYNKGTWPPTKRDGDTDADTCAVDYLLDVGWTDSHIALANSTPTTHRSVDRGGAVIIDRCLTYGGVAPVSMWVDTAEFVYSDHRALGGEVAITSGKTSRCL